jgi:hypothetical protein
MLPDLDNIQVQTIQLAETEFLAPLRCWWENHRKLVDSYLEIVKKYEPFLSRGSEKDFPSAKFSQELVQLLTQHVRPDSDFSFQKELADYLNGTAKYVALFPVWVRSEQSGSALKSVSTERTVIKAGKRVKRFWFVLSRFPWRARNLVLRIMGRQEQPVPSLMRKVPLQNIILNFLTTVLPGELLNRLVLPMLEHMERELKVLQEIDQIFDRVRLGKVSTNQAIRTITQHTGRLRREKQYPWDVAFKQAHWDVLPQLQLHFEKGGTIDLPAGYFSSFRLKRRQAMIESKYRKLVSNSNIRLAGHIDEWQISASVQLLDIQIQSIAVDSGRYIADMLKGRSLESVDKVINSLNELTGMLGKVNNNSDLVNLFNEMTNLVVTGLLGRIIPEATEQVANQDMIVKIQEFTALAMEYTEQMTEAVSVITQEHANGKTLIASDVTRVKLRQLVEHDCLPLLLEPASHMKYTLQRVSNEAREQLLETGRIAEYNLETAVSLLGTDTVPAEVLQIAKEGIGRATGRATETREVMLQLSDEVVSTFDDSYETFRRNLYSYLNLETLLEARKKILKAKALKRSMQLWQRLWGNALKIWFRSAVYLRQIFEYARKNYHYTKIRLGLEVVPPVVSSEISDFLAETQKAISRLPYVYQRLFVLSPLIDEKFFRGRKAELDQLKEAYKNWTMGRYAPTVIVGETGSGSTSLLNLFLVELHDVDIHRMEVSKPVYRQNDFFAMLQLSFPGVVFQNIQEIIRHLNSLPEKQVVVLEGIHHLFIRTIHGSDVIKLLAEIVSATNQHVYWLSTASQYGWQYLDKTLQLSDFFGYVVNLRSLAESEIIDVIMRRHLASGYKLRFELPEGEKPGRKFNQLKDPVQQHEYKKGRYFAALNHFTRSNIAISMLLWLRSASDVKGNEITIALPKGLNVSFIKTLTREKLFLLQALMVHDGLPEDAVAKVLNYTPAKTRLLIIQLFDDGIIVHKQGLYVVNPLLYRQTSTTLKDANLIH